MAVLLSISRTDLAVRSCHSLSLSILLKATRYINLEHFTDLDLVIFQDKYFWSFQMVEI